jgi:hypothetical protein
MRFDDRVTGNLKNYAKQAKILLISPFLRVTFRPFQAKRSKMVQIALKIQ